MQFSLFGAAAAEPSLADLDGVLLGGGHWVRSGPAARLSAVVDDQWRADALQACFRELGLGGEVVPAEAGFAARTEFTERLAPLAARWTRGANEGPPAGFLLSAGGLRLWAIASGRSDGVGFVFVTDSADDVVHLAAGAQLSRLGLGAVSLAGRSGPGWRVTSVKRLRRLAELLGSAPEGAGFDWPS